jgi:hypothetical protein
MSNWPDMTSAVQAWAAKASIVTLHKGTVVIALAGRSTPAWESDITEGTLQAAVSRPAHAARLLWTSCDHLGSVAAHSRSGRLAGACGNRRSLPESPPIRYAAQGERDGEYRPRQRD